MIDDITMGTSIELPFVVTKSAATLTIIIVNYILFLKHIMNNSPPRAIIRQIMPITIKTNPIALAESVDY